MNDFLQKADEIPVTLVVVLAYVTMAMLTDPVSPSAEMLDEYGWITPRLVCEGDWWRLFTSSFLHGGILHLVLNTGAMISLGPAIERTLGSVRLAVLYLVAELGSSLLVCLLNGYDDPVVGGSGALFGMMGGVVAWQMQHGRNALSFLDYDGPRRLIGTIAVYIVIGAFIPFISNAGHVGGLLAGFGVTFLFLTPARHQSARLQSWRSAFVALLLGATIWSLQPFTRWQWLWNTSIEQPDAIRARQLRRAAAMARFGTDDADDAMVRVLQQEILDANEDK